MENKKLTQKANGFFERTDLVSKIRCFLKKYWRELILLLAVYLIFFNIKIPSGYDSHMSNKDSYYYPVKNEQNIRDLIYSGVAKRANSYYWVVNKRYFALEAHLKSLTYVFLTLGILILINKYKKKDSNLGNDDVSAEAIKIAKSSGYKIMQFENNPLLSEIYEKKFLENSFEVKQFSCPSKNVLKEINDYKPDLIITDIVMPEMDGYELIEIIRQNKEFDKIPIAVYSNLSQREEIKKALSLGANEFWVHSEYTPDEIVKNVKKMLGLIFA